MKEFIRNPARDKQINYVTGCRWGKYDDDNISGTSSPKMTGSQLDDNDICDTYDKPLPGDSSSDNNCSEKCEMNVDQINGDPFNDSFRQYNGQIGTLNKPLADRLSFQVEIHIIVILW